MKFRKSFVLFAASTAMLLGGCSFGEDPAQTVVNTVADTPAIIVSAGGLTFNHQRDNDLPYGTILNLAKSWNVDVTINGQKTTATAAITWAITGEGAPKWRAAKDFDPDEYHACWRATFPGVGQDPLNVTFTGTIAYEAASKDVVFNFRMLPKEG